MDNQRLNSLIGIGSDPYALGGAKQIAGSVVNNNPANMQDCCAATLSCLLNFAGIYVGVREAVIDLSGFLSNERGWATVAVGKPIMNGDVGVFIAANGADLHHIYLVIDATDQNNPIVADNQGNGSHKRPVAGGPMPGVGNDASPTTYFLRAT